MTTLQKAVAIEAPYDLVSTRNGAMLVNRNDFYMGVAFLKYGECAQHEIDVLLPLMRLPGAVIEVGANMGVHTIPLAKALAKQGRRMTVFEPQPVIFQQLCANLALNGLMNVTAFNYACGSAPGIVNFKVPDYRGQNNFGGVEMLAEGDAASTAAVLCMTLDSVLGKEHVGLIKIDVEGFELAVLQGAARLIAQSRPVLFVENDRVERSPALIQHLLDLDYRLFWHTPYAYNPNNFAGATENIYGRVRFWNMLCFHRSTGATLPGFEEILLADAHPLAGAS